MIKTIQELKRGDFIHHEFLVPTTGKVVKDFAEVSDIDFDQEQKIFWLALEYQGYLFEESFKTNTGFITQ